MVEGYAKMGNRRALEELRTNRRVIIDTLQSLKSFDTSSALRHNLEELAIIEAGIARFGGSL